jgi:nucleoside-diphosphate-sugar epimerase
VVVTGAAGFIGSHLVAALAGRGHSVVGIDRLPASPAAPGKHRQTDIAERSGVVDEVLRTADAVFHLAALPGVRSTLPGTVARRQHDNVDAARRVLETVPLDVPVIVTSSSSVYGGSTGRPCNEHDRPRPMGGYAESKLEVERLCAKRVSRGGLVAVARPFTVAGEGQRPDMALARWIAAAREGRPLHVLGSLQRSRDITDVRDVVEALLRMADRGVRATVNLGTGQACTLGQMVEAVAAAVGEDVTTTITAAASEEPAATLADTARCQALLGFVPSTDLPALVARQADVARILEVAG